MPNTTNRDVGFLIPISAIIRSAEMAAEKIWSNYGPDVPIQDCAKDAAFETFINKIKEMFPQVSGRDYARAVKVFLYYMDKKLDELRSERQ